QHLATNQRDHPGVALRPGASLAASCSLQTGGAESRLLFGCTQGTRVGSFRRPYAETPAPFRNPSMVLSKWFCWWRGRLSMRSMRRSTLRLGIFVEIFFDLGCRNSSRLTSSARANRTATSAEN